MEVSKSKLGIAIPTYNRSQKLRELLDSIVPQAIKWNVSIFIVDDNSSDRTDVVLKEFSKNFPLLKYKKNRRNLGMYLNTLEAMEFAESQFVWIMGDDDTVKEEGIERVLTSLSENVDYVVLNSVLYDPEFKDIINKNIIKCNGVKTYYRGEHGKLLEDLRESSYHGFMSAMIIRRDLISQRLKEFKSPCFKYYLNNWLPLIVFYRSIVGSNGLFICEPMILNRTDRRFLAPNFWEKSIVGHMAALESLTDFSYNTDQLRRSLGLKLSDMFFFAITSRKVRKENRVYLDYVKRTKMIGLFSKIILRLIDITPYFIIKRMVGD